MNWVDRLLERLLDWRWGTQQEESWDSSYPASPDGMDCPDTQPTSPGVLDSNTGPIGSDWEGDTGLQGTHPVDSR